MDNHDASSPSAIAHCRNGEGMLSNMYFSSRRRPCKCVSCNSGSEARTQRHVFLSVSEKCAGWVDFSAAQKSRECTLNPVVRDISGPD